MDYFKPVLNKYIIPFLFKFSFRLGLQLYNINSLQIYVSWTISYQYLICPLFFKFPFRLNLKLFKTSTVHKSLFHGLFLTSTKSVQCPFLFKFPFRLSLQLFNVNNSKIHVQWTIFNQYLTSPLFLFSVSFL